MAVNTTEVTGILVLVNGEYLNNKEIKASSVDQPQFVRQSGVIYIVDSEASTVTTSTGTFSLDLVSGSKLRLEVLIVGYDKIVTIPSTGPVDFMDLVEVT